MICSVVLKNTAIARLRTHRNRFYFCSTSENYYQNMNNITIKTEKNNINSDIETISPQLKEEIDISLAKFFFGCNIPFPVIDSDNFKNFINTLRSDYSLPCREMLSTVLLDKTNEDLQTNKYLVNESTLLVNTSNIISNVITTLQIAGGQRLFLDSYDVCSSRKSREVLVGLSCQESIKLAESRYGYRVYAIVSGNSASLCKMPRLAALWHTSCNSHIANLLANAIADVDTIATVNRVLKEFKYTDLENLILECGGIQTVLPTKSRWCSIRDACVSLINNLPIMKNIVTRKNAKIRSDVVATLRDEHFIAKVKATIILLNPVSELIEKCQSTNFSIADAAEEWINFKKKMLEQINTTSVVNAVNSHFQKAMNVYCLTANLLHPVYRGTQLDKEQLDAVQKFLVQSLDIGGIHGFNAYYKNEGYLFENLKEKELDGNTYWDIVSTQYPTLAAFALRLLKIPASSIQFDRVVSNSSFVHTPLRNHLAGKRYKKLLYVYHSLKLADANNSDEY